MKYKVILHYTEEGISVSVPGLPGCWSEGDTEKEALENIQDAIQSYLAAVQSQKLEPNSKLVEVAVSKDLLNAKLCGYLSKPLVIGN